MEGTRALFASIGASVALVAAAALSLLTISAVFAFGGWSAPASPFPEEPALVLASVSGDGPITASGASPIVAPAPARRAERRDTARPAASRPRAASAPAPAATRASAGSPRVVSPPPIEWEEAGEGAVPAPPAARKTGDHVRKVGDSLSATVEGTGAALASVTQPLSPPVSVVVQQVLNVVAEVINRATDGLGGAVDTLLTPKQ